jgi:hypothetical protein
MSQLRLIFSTDHADVYNHAGLHNSDGSIPVAAYYPGSEACCYRLLPSLLAWEVTMMKFLCSCLEAPWPSQRLCAARGLMLLQQQHCWAPAAARDSVLQLPQFADVLTVADHPSSYVSCVSRINYL